MAERITVILPCRNEADYIDRAIESIVKSDVTNYEWELFVVDGNSTDGTAEKVRAWSEANGRISLLHNEKKTVPCAMNIGIRQASGDIIIRVDAHAEYDPHYFSYVIEHLAHYDAANVGTRIVTRAKNGSRTGRAIAFVLSDKLGVGNSYFRIGTDTVKEVDTVPFGCYRREIFDEVGLYDERLTKSQDIELNKRIKRSGGSIILLPNHPIIYYSRENYRDLARKYIVNGKWNILVAYYTNSFRSLSYRNFFPLIFFSAVLALALLSVLHGGFGAAAGGLLGFYFLFIMLRSLRKKRGDFPAVFLAYLVLHLSHAAGALWGIFSLLNPKTRRDKKLPKW